MPNVIIISRSYEMGLTVKIIENNKAKVLDELEEAIERALEAMGLQGENYAKASCTAVDTGLLRNSITHAIGGQGAATQTYTADTPKKGKPSTGSYGGTAPGTNKVVYVGTNVEYAPYVEEGHRLPSGGHVPGVHFIRNGVLGHFEELAELAEDALKGF